MNEFEEDGPTRADIGKALLVVGVDVGVLRGGANMSIVRKLLDWLNDKPPCEHRWRVLLEHYPSYAYDWWKCDHCGETMQCTEDEAPVKVKTDICSMGHIHIVN